jgi:hypothetical protein
MEVNPLIVAFKAVEVIAADVVTTGAALRSGSTNVYARRKCV